MTPDFATRLAAMGDWRASHAAQLDGLAAFLGDHELIDDTTTSLIGALLERLANEKLVIAFVAEFSRGKSELINAIFFADTGRRVLPATPGRTTMCPVELAWDDEEGPSLRLLPIETRLDGVSLGELRNQRRAWKQVQLQISNPDQLSESLLEVTRTRFVGIDEARALGFWDDAHPVDNPPLDDEGRAEVPAWRHALINYPHPLLRQGLVVLDTPGLNAIGAEPELTLSLLPTAHATLFILGADSGVSKSDLAIWRDHLGSPALTRFVVLNKIDALIDPLSTAEETEAHIVLQCQKTARTLGIGTDRIFPLSARQALAARIEGDDAELVKSRLPALEAALGAQLLPRRRELLEQALGDVTRQIDNHVQRRTGEQRRQLAEQLLELRGLRGKSSTRIQLMLQRVDAETAEFEQCTVRLQATRMVHGRMLKEALAVLSADRVRDEVGAMQRAMQASLLNLGAKRAFLALGERLGGLLSESGRHSLEIYRMLGGSFNRLNAEFSFSLSLSDPPDLSAYNDELALIQRSYIQYLGLTQALRLSNAKFMEQFRRMLVSKLRVVFEGASSELELWNKGASAQIDSQLRERRRNFRRRRESLERVQSASSELETRLMEIEAQDGRLQSLHTRARQLLEALRDKAATRPAEKELQPHAQGVATPVEPIVVVGPSTNDHVPVADEFARAIQTEPGTGAPMRLQRLPA